MYTHIEPTSDERRTAMDYRFAFITRDYRRLEAATAPRRSRRTARHAK
jgi:hypothetical protein